MPLILRSIPRRSGQWVELVPDAGDPLRLPAHHVPSWAAAGAQVEEAQWAEWAAQSRRQLLLDKAVALLARREHFTAELRRKLSQREPDHALVDSVLAECVRQGYVDDARAAQAYARELAGRGGMGSPRLRAELLRKGCPRHLAEAALVECVGLIDEGAETEALLAKRERAFRSKLATLQRKLELKQPDARRRAYELKRQFSAAVANYLAGQGLLGEEARAVAARFTARLLAEVE